MPELAVASVRRPDGGNGSSEIDGCLNQTRNSESETRSATRWSVQFSKPPGRLEPTEPADLMKRSAIRDSTSVICCFAASYDRASIRATRWLRPSYAGEVRRREQSLPRDARAAAVLDTAGLTVERAAARLVEMVAPVLAKDARAFGLQRAAA